METHSQRWHSGLGLVILYLKAVLNSLHAVCSGMRLHYYLWLIERECLLKQCVGDPMDAYLDLYGNYNDYRDYGEGCLFMRTLGSLYKGKNKLMF